jgi:hypothetical protein
MKKLVFFLMMSIFVCVLQGCQNDVMTPIAENVEQENSLFNTDYLSGVTVSGISNEQLVDIHLVLADFYYKRNMLFEDWSNRTKYDLPAEVFSNEYIQKETQMEFYDYVRARSPQESEYLEGGLHTKSVHILTDKISWGENGIVIIPIKAQIRKASNWDAEKISFYAFNTDYKIINYQYGGIFDELSIATYQEYGKEQWGRSYYNEKYLQTLPENDASAIIFKRTLEFMNNNIPKEEFHSYTRKGIDVPAITLRAGSTISALYRGNTYLYMMTYSTSYNPAYKSLYPVDCANFISQCLKFGGFVYKSGNATSASYWWYDDKGTTTTSDDTYSQSWSTANGLKNYISGSGVATTVSAYNLYNGIGVEVGDPFFIRIDLTKSEYQHSMMVFGTTSGTTYCCHTNDRFNSPMSSIGNSSYWENTLDVKAFHITNYN